MQQNYAFIKNGEIYVISPLDEFGLSLSLPKIPVEKINWEKYNSGYDIHIQNNKCVYSQGERYIKNQQKRIENDENHRKFERIFQKLLEIEILNAETDHAILEDVEFSDKQIGDLILHRVFGGNPHAESAMQAKVIAMLLEGKQDETLLAEVMQKKAKINEIRVFFGLAEI